jgi:hypothetical protein
VRIKRIAIILVGFLSIVAAIYFFKNIRHEATRVQVDALYTYFHKIQDSIKKKNYPLNMDSLKREVNKSMMTIKIWEKLDSLEKSVRAYKQP